MSDVQLLFQALQQCTARSGLPTMIKHLPNISNGVYLILLYSSLFCQQPCLVNILVYSLVCVHMLDIVLWGTVCTKIQYIHVCDIYK